jgi:hypothetical protein
MLINLSILVALSYVVLQTLITISYGSRVAGGLSNNPALGTTIQHTFYVGSSVLLVLIMPISGFLIESNVTASLYFKVVFFSMLISSLMSYFILIYLEKVQKFFQKVFFYYSNNFIPTAILKALSTKKIDYQYSEIKAPFSLSHISLKKCFFSFIAYAFITSSYFVIFLLSIYYIDHRLTISQFNIALQGFGTFLISFYIDPILSRSIDKISIGSNAWITNIYSILLGRVLALFSMSILFFIVYILVE